MSSQQKILWEIIVLFFFHMTAALIRCWVRFLSYYGAIAAAWHISCIYLFRAFPMHTATTPQTSRGLLAVGPDMTEVLAVLALHKISLSSV
jgi:hypothetical protein